MAGLLGSGRTETARAVFAADRPDGGTIRFGGREQRFATPVGSDRCRAWGSAREDRKIEGIIPDMSVRENLTLALLPQLSRSGIVDEARQREIVDRFIAMLGVKCSGPEQKIRELSGGNQQKVLLARWMCMNPKLLILDEPTRGIDVGAKAEIQALIRELADQGLGVLMISSELEEVIEGSDRVFVLRDGRTVAEFAKAEISEPAVMSAMAHGDDPRCGLSWVVPRPLRHGRGAGGADRVQLRLHAQLRLAADAQRQPDPGLHHRHRRRRHDPGDRHRRHRPVGRLADGDLRRGGAADLPGQAVSPAQPRGRRGPGLRRAGPGRGMFGLFNGWLITRFRIQPIIATLVLFIAGRGIAQVMTNGDLQVFKTPEFQFIGLGRVLGIPFQVWIMAVIVIVAAWALRRTVFGRQVLATGGNEAAARLSGVPTSRVKLLVYGISGLLSGIAGLIVIAINSSSDANLVGLGMELDAIAAVAVGGTLLSGGRATVVGTLLGALIIQLVRYTLLANGVPDAAALVVKALIIVLAVWLQRRSGA